MRLRDAKRIYNQLDEVKKIYCENQLVYEAPQTTSKNTYIDYRAWIYFLTSRFVDIEHFSFKRIIFTNDFTSIPSGCRTYKYILSTTDSDYNIYGMFQSRSSENRTLWIVSEGKITFTQEILNTIGQFSVISSSSSTTYYPFKYATTIQFSNFYLDSDVIELSFLNTCSYLQALDLSSNHFNFNNINNFQLNVPSCVQSIILYPNLSLDNLYLSCSNCSYLTTFDFSNYNIKNIYIPGDCFVSCTSLEEILFPNNIEHIYIINSQNFLKPITINAYHTLALFSNCRNLTKITKTNKIHVLSLNLNTHNEIRTFYLCEKLDFDSSTIDLSFIDEACNLMPFAYFYRTFYGCALLRNISIDLHNFKQSGLFNNCQRLQSVKVLNCDGRYDAMFVNCTSLQTLTDLSLWTNPISLESTFAGSGLNNFTFPDTWILQDSCNLSNTFNNCTNLMTINFNKFFDLSKNEFDRCYSIDPETGEESLSDDFCSPTAILALSSTFKDCVNLTKIDNFFLVNSYLMSLSLSSAFENCSMLSNIENIISNIKATINDFENAFKGCSHLFRFKIDNSLKSTYYDFKIVSNIFTTKMFEDCENLQSVYLTDGWEDVEYIHSTQMFKNCTNLTEIYLRDDLNSNYSFYSCSQMFYNCINLHDINGNSFNLIGLEGTYRLGDTTQMFYNCRSLYVIDLGTTRFGLNGPIQDANSFGIYNVSGMFVGCTNLYRIISYQTHFLQNMSPASTIFKGCENLQAKKYVAGSDPITASYMDINPEDIETNEWKYLTQLTTKDPYADGLLSYTY